MYFVQDKNFSNINNEFTVACACRFLLQYCFFVLTLSTGNSGRLKRAHITKQRGKTKQMDMIAKVFYTSPRAWNSVLSGRTSDSPRFRKQDQTSRKWRLNSQRLKWIWTGLFPCTWPNIMCFQKHLLFKTKEVNYTIFEQAANRLIHIK